MYGVFVFPLVSFFLSPKLRTLCAHRWDAWRSTPGFVDLFYHISCACGGYIHIHSSRLMDARTSLAAFRFNGYIAALLWLMDVQLIMCCAAEFATYKYLFKVIYWLALMALPAAQRSFNWNPFSFHHFARITRWRSHI